ncbi:MAG: DinB family protein [Chloroflexi bacterium]|nr:DinB family protein [Chloroflexota bacterium]
MSIRTQLITAELARHRAPFEHLCRSLGPGDLAATIPGSHWTVKDYIAHLATIDGLIAASFAPMVGQSAPFPDTPFPDPFDIDDWNEAAVRARERRTIEELLAEAADHRDRMATAIAAMTDEDLDRLIPYGGDRKTLNLPKSTVRFGGLLWAIAIHDPTHTRDILRALPHLAEQSWLSEWLATVTDALVPEGVKEQRV